MSTTLNLVELREGGVGDLATVDRIMRDAFDPRYGEAWTTSQTNGMLVLPGTWLTLASIDGQDGGFAFARAIAGESELLLLAVRPAARRRGLGGALLRSVLLEARQRNAEKLHIEVRAGNTAIQLYAREGFVKIGQRKAYYRGRNGEQYDANSYSRILD